MSETTRISAEMPCYNQCIRRGTENDDQPQLVGARHGNFCDKEYHSTIKALQLAAPIVEHVLSMLDAKGSPADRVDGGSDQAPLPMNEQAQHDANETYRRLVYYSRTFAAQMGVQAPGPSVRAWRDRVGNIPGLPDGVTTAGARYLVGIMATWLTLNLENINHLPDVDSVAYFHNDMRDIYRINARWPQEPKPYYSKLHCPDDDARIAVYPPTEFRDETRYKCEKCGRIFEEGLGQFYEELFKGLEADAGTIEAKRAIRKADRTRSHLAAKYIDDDAA